MKRLRNTSGLSDETVRSVVDWLATDLGIAGFDVECRSSASTIVGRAYTSGSSYHTSARPFVVLRIGKDARFPKTIAPYQYRHHKGKRYVLASRTEALVYIAAHELRHLWQAAKRTDKRRSKPLPMYHGSRSGKFSEVDTESYAIHSLRQWRRLTPDDRSSHE